MKGLICRYSMVRYTKTRTAILCILLFIVFVNLSCFDQHVELGGEAYRSPIRFEEAIETFEAKDKKDRPGQGAIVCVGSSSIRRWNVCAKAARNW